jgi:hypothetical protein
MNCQGAEKLFVDAVYGELDAKREAVLRAHLDSCPSCASRLAELARVRRLVSTRPDLEPSSMTVQRVLAHARDEATSSPPLWRMGWLKAALPIGFVVVVGGWVLFEHFMSPKASLPPASHGPVRAPTSAPPAPAVREKAPPREALPLPEEAKETNLTSPLVKEAPATGKLDRTEPGVLPPAAGPQPSPPEKSREKEPGVAAGRKAVSSPRAQEARPATPQPRPAQEPIQPAPPPAPAPADGESKRERAGPAADKGQPPGADMAQGLRAKAKEAPLANRDKTSDLSIPGREPTGMAPKTAAPPATGGGAMASRPITSSALPLVERGESLLQTGDFQQAGEAFSKALSLLPTGDPDRPRSLLGLAKAREGMGQWREAQRLYQMLADESPTHREEALRKVREIDRPGQ